jgi:hypothetical protein
MEENVDITRKLLTATAAHYVATRSRSVPVSTAEGVRVLRAVVPETTLSDRELANCVAEAAVAQRRQILFDNVPNRTDAPHASPSTGLSSANSPSAR